MLSMTRFRRRVRLHYLFALVSSAWADYYIDDTNSTLSHSSGPNAVWGSFAAVGKTLELELPNGTYQSLDPYLCYNHTYLFMSCFGTDVCLLTVPFTGSGITVYVYQAGPVGANATITIDGAHAHTKVLSAPPAPDYEIANVSMFDVQQLQSGPHSLVLLVNDFFGSYSTMSFDYAYVNESLVTGAASASTIATASASAISTYTSAPVDPSPVSYKGVGGIVGGVVGGVVLVAVGLLAFLWIRRRRRRASETVTDSPSPPFRPRVEYDPLAANAYASGTHPPYAPTDDAVGDGYSLSRSTVFSTLPVLNHWSSSEDPRVSSTPSSGRSVSAPFAGARGLDDPAAHSARRVLSSDTARAPTPRLQTGQNSPSGSRREAMPSLTDEQADFIHSLHRSKVPAAAIARVMERMLAGQRVGIQEWDGEMRLLRTHTVMTLPPSYKSCNPGAERA